MTKKDFSLKIVKSSENYWAMVVRGQRNLGYKRAQRVSDILGTSIDLWINPHASVNDRREAWEKFSKEMK